MEADCTEIQISEAAEKAFSRIKDEKDLPAILYWKKHKWSRNKREMTCPEKLAQIYKAAVENRVKDKTGGIDAAGFFEMGFRDSLRKSPDNKRDIETYIDLGRKYLENGLEIFFLNAFLGIYDILHLYDMVNDVECDEEDTVKEVMIELKEFNSSILRGYILDSFIDKNNISNSLWETKECLEARFKSKQEDKLTSFSEKINKIIESTVKEWKENMKESYEEEYFVSYPKKDYFETIDGFKDEIFMEIKKAFYNYYLIIISEGILEEMKEEIDSIINKYKDLPNLGKGGTWKEICNSYYIRDKM